MIEVNICPRAKTNADMRQQFPVPHYLSSLAETHPFGRVVRLCSLFNKCMFNAVVASLSIFIKAYGQEFIQT